MRLPTLPTKQVVDHLNAVYFQKTWNAPRENRRANVRLYKVATRVKTGLVQVGRTVVGLPTTDTVYAVYQTGYRVFSQFMEIQNDTWLNAEEYLITEDMTTTIFGSSGRTVPVKGSFIRYISDRDTIIVVVPAKYTKKCTGDLYPDLYLTVFKDLTRSTPTQIKWFQAGTILNGSTPIPTIESEINTASTLYPNKSFVTVNGWSYECELAPAIANDDIVEITIDPDIVGYVDVTVDDSDTGYYSSLYGEYREIIHIPKSMNPSNIVINTDNLTTLVFNSENNKGVLGHRVSDHALEPITHNDFSMSRTSISGFTDTLEAVTVIVRVYVRVPVETNILNDDVNHIKDLYSLNDSKIMSQLLGNAQNQIPEWTASHLEQSKFLRMTNSDERQDIDQAITTFVEGMGYYDVASVLGQQMRFYTYHNAQVKIRKPVRLFGYRCQAIVYANGIKVKEGDYRINDFDSNTFLLGFTEDSGVNSGDRIGLYIFEEGYRTPHPFSPTTQVPSISFDSPDYTVYLEETYSEAQPVWGATSLVGYKRVPKGNSEYIVSQNSDGGYKFTFTTKNFNKKFYLIPKYGLTTAKFDLVDIVDNHKPIVTSLKTMDIMGSFIPILGYETMEVYLNGKRLVENLDYRADPVLDPDGFILQNLLTVTNCDYLNLEDGTNFLEVCVHGDKVVSEDKGYEIENKLYRSAIPMIFSKSSSRSYIRGVLQETITESGNIAEHPGQSDNGAPFLMQHYLSFGASKLMGDLSPNQDDNLRSRIEHVLGFETPSAEDIVIVDHLHALYSVFLGQIVMDVGNGDYHIRDEPSDINFIKQFKPYALLLERDPTVGPLNVLIDSRFVTLAAHYENFSTTDPDQLARMQRLTSLTLTPSGLSINEVLL